MHPQYQQKKSGEITHTTEPNISPPPALDSQMIIPKPKHPDDNSTQLYSAIIWEKMLNENIKNLTFIRIPCMAPN